MGRKPTRIFNCMVRRPGVVESRRQGMKLHETKCDQSVSCCKDVKENKVYEKVIGFSNQ